MGKPKKKLRTLKSGNKKTNIGEKYSVADLLEKVEECLDQFQYELAIKFCQRALELEPDNIQVLETMGSILVETGNPQEGAEYFTKAINLSPDEGHTKYMYLGQLLKGQEAAKHFKKGIDLMISQYQHSLQSENNNSAASSSVLNEVNVGDISSAYCSLAEIYMTDSCFEENAETECETSCQKAIEYDPTNPDAYQVMANFLLSRNKTEEAKQLLVKSLELWQGKEEEPPQVPAPSYESRISTSKLLIEMSQYEMAEEVLDGLLEEDEDVVQVWYLLGWLYVLSENKASAKIYLEKAKQLFSKVACDDEPMLEHINELLDNLGAMGPETDQGEIEEEADEMEEYDEDENEHSMDTSGS